MAEPAYKQDAASSSGERARTVRSTERAAANDSEYAQPARRTSGERRGIQNVERVTRKNADLYADKTVSGRFETRESVPARTKRKKNKKDADTSRQTQPVRQRSASRRSPRAARGVRRKYLPKRALRRGARHFGFGAWMRVGIATTMYMWQLWFAIFALLGYGSEVLIREFQQDTWVGWVISWVIDIQKWFPGEIMGNVFTAINLFVIGGTFLAFFAIYWVLNYKPFGTPGMFFISTTCFALSIFPVTNILPFIVFWVFFMEVHGVYSNRRS